MIDARFSRKAFEEAEDPEALAASLKEEVVLAIQPAVEAGMRAVIEQLNGLGHELVDEQLPDPDEVLLRHAGGRGRPALCLSRHHG